MNDRKAVEARKYMDRNGAWVLSLVAAFIILFSCAFAHLFDNAPSWMPAWLPYVTSAAPFLVAAGFAAMTDTRSARLVRFYALGGAVGILILGSVGLAESLGRTVAKLANVDTSNVAIEIAPGLAIRDGDGEAQVSGFQKCAEQSRVMRSLFGPTSWEGQSNCIVIEKTTQTVQVQVHSRHDNTYENSVETWKVVRFPDHPDRMSLMRPSGEFVSPVKR
ncbi:hypothetical protein G0R39_004483 [Salmonella enterica]|nr:hypothetical protein [Salmonella enterica]